MILSIVYFLAEQYPWWGIPLALILIETGLHFRRNGRTMRAVVLFLIAISLIGLAGFFIWGNGIQNVRPFLREIEYQYFRE